MRQGDDIDPAAADGRFDPRQGDRATGPKQDGIVAAVTGEAFNLRHQHGAAAIADDGNGFTLRAADQRLQQLHRQCGALGLRQGDDIGAAITNDGFIRQDNIAAATGGRHVQHVGDAADDNGLRYTTHGDGLRRGPHRLHARDIEGGRRHIDEDIVGAGAADQRFHVADNRGVAVAAQRDDVKAAAADQRGQARDEDGVPGIIGQDGAVTAADQGFNT